jgi:hypothetical protein
VSVPLAAEVPEPPALIVPEPAAIDALVTVKVTPLFVYVAPAVGVTVTPDTVNWIEVFQLSSVAPIVSPK